MMVFVISISMIVFLFQKNAIVNGQSSDEPSGQPSGQPTVQPSCQPSGRPSGQPTGDPSGQPSGEPSYASDDLCAPGCYDGWPGDNWCDTACYNEACNWDEGDCNYLYDDDYDDNCAPGCYDGWPGDNWCDTACNNAACNWDEGDCTYDDDFFDDDFFDDDFFDDDFFNDDFFNDDDIVSTTCNWLCDSSELGDGTCNYWCSGSDCNYDGGDCVEQCDNTNECALDNVFVGRCGFFAKNTDKWCEFDGTVVCCSDNNDFSDDCCESDPVKISITVGGVFLLCIAPCICGCIWAWRKKHRDNTNDTPPKCCYKLWCPACSIISHQGCESKMDICMSYFCCCFFTLCCWSPKAVIIHTIDNDNNTIEMTNTNTNANANINTIANTNDNKYAIV